MHEPILRPGTKLRLVIFDCDGVLIDSEPIVNELVAVELTRLGWPMTASECYARFLGLSLDDMVPLIEAALGRSLPTGWPESVVAEVVNAFQHRAPMIAGAKEVLSAVTALGLPWRIASNSSHQEMEAKFGCNGLLPMVRGRLHSFTDVPRGKPFPDLFLAAAAAECVQPSACLVVEDSVPGVRGAVAAGMQCLGYTPHGNGAALTAVGAIPLASLFDLPGILRTAMQARA